MFPCCWLYHHGWSTNFWGTFDSVIFFFLFKYSKLGSFLPARFIIEHERHTSLGALQVLALHPRNFTVEQILYFLLLGGDHCLARFLPLLSCFRYHWPSTLLLRPVYNVPPMWLPLFTLEWLRPNCGSLCALEALASTPEKGALAFRSTISSWFPPFCQGKRYYIFWVLLLLFWHSASVSQICKTFIWSSVNTFSKFYQVDVSTSTIRSFK